MKICSLFSAFLLLCLVFVSCNSEQKDWTSTNKTCTAEGYTNFISKHPKSRFIEAATHKLDSLKLVILINNEWQEAAKSRTLVKIESFLEKYPVSLHSEEAVSLADSISIAEAAGELKIHNSIVDTLHLRDLKTYYARLATADQQNILDVLVKRFDYIKGTRFLIDTVTLAGGPDLAKTLSPSIIEGSGNISQDSKSGKLIVKLNGTLCGRYLDECMMIGKGNYVSKVNADKINIKGSYTVSKYDENILFSTYYPSDKLYFKPNESQALVFKQAFGQNTVIRITGTLENYFANMTIRSDEQNPLHFILRNNGIYYLLGKGEVDIKDSKHFSY